VGTTSYGSANADNGYVSLGNSISGSESFTYDGNQNMTFDGVNTLTYDVENRLVEAENAAWGTSTYLYDPLGHRKQKTVEGVTTLLVLAGGQEIADYNGTGVCPASMLTVRGVGGLPVAAIMSDALFRCFAAQKRKQISLWGLLWVDCFKKVGNCG
jgi:YD repeat-containing protein